MDHQEALFSIVRSGLNLVPFGGGSVASLWADWASSRRFKRVEDAFVQLAEEVRNRETRIDSTKLGDAEMHLLEEVVSRIAAEHRKERRERLVRTLLSGWIHTDRTFEERSRFGRAIEECSDLDMLILDVLQQREVAGLPPIPVQELSKDLASTKGIDTRRQFFLPSMTRLAQTYGFIFRNRSAHGHKLMFGINPDGLTYHADCELSPLGRRFLESMDGL